MAMCDAYRVVTLSAAALSDIDMPQNSLFSLCYLLLEKSSKSLIPLSDCPFVLNRLPVFLENLPVSGKKTGLAELLDHGHNPDANNVTCDMFGALFVIAQYGIGGEPEAFLG